MQDDSSPFIRLIGDVRLSNGPVDLRRKARQVFAVLAAHAGEFVPTDQLIRELWGNEHPRNRLQSIYVYVSNLRKLKIVDVKAGPNQRGYVMEVDPCEVDLHVFMKNQQQIRRLLECGDLPEADRLLTISAALNAGPPFGHLECGEILRGWKQVFAEHLRAAVRDRYELRLRQGRHREVVTDLLIACQKYPYDEDLAVKLMLALHRCNRRLEVLEVYQRLLRAVQDELGLSVSSWVQKLYQLVLTDDERLNDLNIRFSM